MFPQIISKCYIFLYYFLHNVLLFNIFILREINNNLSGLFRTREMC